MNGENPEITWPSAIVACTLIALVGTITVTAIVRYTADDALKVWSALGPVVGVITGVLVTYFFTRKAVEIEKKHAADAEKKATTNNVALTKLAGLLPPDTWQAIAGDPVIAKAFASE